MFPDLHLSSLVAVVHSHRHFPFSSANGEEERPLLALDRWNSWILRRPPSSSPDGSFTRGPLLRGTCEPAWRVNSADPREFFRADRALKAAPVRANALLGEIPPKASSSLHVRLSQSPEEKTPQLLSPASQGCVTSFGTLPPVRSKFSFLISYWFLYAAFCSILAPPSWSLPFAMIHHGVSIFLFIPLGGVDICLSRCSLKLRSSSGMLVRFRPAAHVLFLFAE